MTDAPPDPEDVARAILAATVYMTLATADADGRPWATPVYAVLDDPAELLWVSRPETQHSRNIAARPEVSAVVFDTNTPVGEGRAVYVRGRAELVPDADLARCVERFSRVSQQDGGRSWAIDAVQVPAPLRLYRLVSEERWVLGEGDRRIALP